MRFYDYLCSNESCRNIDEYYERTNDDQNIHNCSLCNSESFRKISAPAFRFEDHGKFISKKERQRRWKSNDPKDKI